MNVYSVYDFGKVIAQLDFALGMQTSKILAGLQPMSLEPYQSGRTYQ